MSEEWAQTEVRSVRRGAWMRRPPVRRRLLQMHLLMALAESEGSSTRERSSAGRASAPQGSPVGAGALMPGSIELIPVPDYARAASKLRQKTGSGFGREFPVQEDMLSVLQKMTVFWCNPGYLCYR